MIPEAENKMIDPQAQKADDPAKVTMKAAEAPKRHFHFAGVPDWKPLSVLAATIEEATGLWKKSRQPAKEETQPNNA